MPAESFTVDRLERMLKSVRELNADAYKHVEKALTDELKEFRRLRIAVSVQAFRDHDSGPGAGRCRRRGRESAAGVYGSDVEAISRPGPARMGQQHRSRAHDPPPRHRTHRLPN